MKYAEAIYKKIYFQLNKLREHIRFLQNRLAPHWMIQLALDNKYKIWYMKDEDIDLVAELIMEPGQRRYVLY